MGQAHYLVWFLKHIGLLHRATKTHAKQRFQMPYCSVCADPEGQGSRSPWKITKLPLAYIPCWSIIGLPGKHHLNSVSLAGQWYPAFCGIWILSLLIKKKMLSELVLHCQGQFQGSKVTCTECFCFPLSASRDVHLLETSFQKSLCQGHSERPMRFPTMQHFDKCSLRWVCSSLA